MFNINALQYVENRAAELQKRKPAKIVAGSFPKGLERIGSMYERTKNQIIMNNDLFNQLSDMELIATVLHEGRHAYQWEQIQNPKNSLESKDLIDQWSQEFDSYEQGLANSLDEKYLTLAIEVDAVSYADLNMQNIAKVNLQIHPLMKDLVLKRQSEIKGRDHLV
ncbi:MAG: DUF6782 family putative metallopeptidase [Candidatus Izemoplasmatales bacterium]|jgi:hypothetical protein